MIVNTTMRNDQVEQRILLRSSASTLANVIAEGTSCSRFEAEVIVDKAQEVFGLGPHGVDNTLQPGQMIWKAIDATEPPGKPLAKCKYLRIVLTVHHVEEDRDVYRTHGRSAMRGQQILRMCEEAMSQGTYLTVEDLGIILDCDERTIRNDIKRLSEAQEIMVPTRGNKCDIGPGITHRDKIVELYIRDLDEMNITRQMTHSLKAVERYVQSFCRILYCQQQVHDTLQTALIVGKSTHLVERCLALRDRFKSTPEYRERLEEIQEKGSRYWEAIDGKKKPGQEARRPK